jgi:hypothetical protein
MVLDAAVEYRRKCSRVADLFKGVGLPVRILMGTGGLLSLKPFSNTITDTVIREAHIGPDTVVSTSLIMDDLGTPVYDEGRGGGPRIGLLYEPTMIHVEFATNEDAFTKGFVPELVSRDGMYYTTDLEGKFPDFSKVQDVLGPEFPDGTIAGLSLKTMQCESEGYNEMLIRCKDGSTMGPAILGGVLINGAAETPKMVAEFRDALDATVGPGIPLFTYNVHAADTPLHMTDFGGQARRLPQDSHLAWINLQRIWGVPVE